ncbi:acyl-CoA thioesterase-1 [Oryzisolibacter propanilivorax]|uniref:Acyl-CoA thioesterase-1 n=1 Tax=Oryzisolibacter propanilivorax TaxID=1527607 RepID=A0A1G9SWF7_9BURK|nr:acyl-CoA thioesterase-1 [Oryzisolibacter propanilivorax]
MNESNEAKRLGRRDFSAALLALAAAGLPAAGHAADARQPVILVLGDSLSAEYGLARGSGWVALLEQRLARESIAARVVNASVSGETTSGGRARLPALLKAHRPTHVILELGANDALRGLPLKNTEDNLAWMAQQAQAAGARVLLLGMQVPPNYGGDYGRRFAGLFESVAKRQKAALVPFFLKGVADVPDAARLFQADRIHPNAQAHPTMLDNVWPQLRRLLR